MGVLLIELNELNIEYVRAYIARGKLKTFARLMAAHGLVRTTSEQSKEALEPWIQWVTAHTGKSAAEHGVFRLGDITKHEIPQIWEVLEQQGLSVGAISPMNAKNRCIDPAFFVPDPWTPTPVTAPWLLRRLHSAISQAVNDNASAKLTAPSLFWLLVGLARYARPGGYGRYIASAISAARQRRWHRALVLDQLLTDVFLSEVGRRKPQFASLFLNAAAHIQHHYLFNSQVYDGKRNNPAWYSDPSSDPVLEAYQLYDTILARIQLDQPETRLIIATGLHQEPHAEATFYWRPRDHGDLLRRLGVSFTRVEARMSRDFIVVCDCASAASVAAERLLSARTLDATPLFEVDSRGAELFVTLAWRHEIPADFEYFVGNSCIRGLREDVALVALKNGEHDGIGYLIDSALTAGEVDGELPLRELPNWIASACGRHWPGSGMSGAQATRAA